MRGCSKWSMGRGEDGWFISYLNLRPWCAVRRTPFLWGDAATFAGERSVLLHRHLPTRSYREQTAGRSIQRWWRTNSSNGLHMMASSSKADADGTVTGHVSFGDAVPPPPPSDDATSVADAAIVPHKLATTSIRRLNNKCAERGVEELQDVMRHILKAPSR